MLANQFRNLRTPLGISMAMVHPYEGLNRIRVPPDVVKSGLIRAAQMRQGLKKPLFTAINGGRDVFAPGLQFQQRCQAQRRSSRSECVVWPGTRENVQVFRTSALPQEPLGFWSSSKNATPRSTAFWKSACSGISAAGSRGG